MVLIMNIVLQLLHLIQGTLQGTCESSLKKTKYTTTSINKVPLEPMSKYDTDGTSGSLSDKYLKYDILFPVYPDCSSKSKSTYYKQNHQMFVTAWIQNEFEDSFISDQLPDGEKTGYTSLL